MSFALSGGLLPKTHLGLRVRDALSDGSQRPTPHSLCCRRGQKNASCCSQGPAAVVIGCRSEVTQAKTVACSESQP